jgi:hypothetical protein
MILGLLRNPFRRRAFTRRTQNPLSSLWKMTRSIMPETCSVAGLRSGVGDCRVSGWGSIFPRTALACVPAGSPFCGDLAAGQGFRSARRFTGQ